jgi:hypothetical protein
MFFTYLYRFNLELDLHPCYTLAMSTHAAPTPFHPVPVRPRSDGWPPPVSTLRSDFDATASSIAMTKFVMPVATHGMLYCKTKVASNPSLQEHGPVSVKTYDDWYT